jgi:serine kinase of HPr protein (carbohydrate metabolism regulator)
MPRLLHGTALVVGTAGLILVGPSGSGKSSLAVQLLAGARRSGHFAALVADDQVFIDWVNGRAIATAPATIKGMVELYGSGIGKMPTISRAMLHFALQPLAADSASRIPEDGRRWPPDAEETLPLAFIDRAVADPFDWLTVLISGFPIAGTFQL